MTLNSKLDLAKSNQKGLVNVANEFAGYAAVGLAGLGTAFMVDIFGAREGLFYFSLTVITVGLFLATFTVSETLPWAHLHTSSVEKAPKIDDYPKAEKSLFELFKFGTLENKSLMALNQAGLVEKFTDAIVWIFMPVYFISKDLTLIEAGAIIAIYGVVLWARRHLNTFD